ncbi:PP2C family protein-serine/threonine phosphatase [Staphylospora marina]|uniref:PP2C family protein-serine/threonine phosphatase n=1 Tax=Staphylospora marina TaxID=2490858 RepID=UPI000F5C0D03|nr:PP2C family protein-serine/threonine phosphatase [Staphylospora marina]
MDDRLRRYYEKLLASHMKDPREDHLYSAGQLSKWFMEKRIPPEEVINLHISTVRKLVPDLPPEVTHSFNLLLEVMVGYGLAYRDREHLMDLHRELENEIEVAVGMQQTLLPSAPPDPPGLEIGVLSVAARQMNGDYYNFVDHGNGLLGVAVADIIGKGIPAALCMSMIKYAMDRYDDQALSPSEILRGLNTVVERNVDPSMFITMIYGVYDTLNHEFRYATAGHEPGLHYSAAEDGFRDLETKGLILGVLRHVDYPEFTVRLDPGDAIILFSDGVTECRLENGDFLERDTLIAVIREQIDLPAQQAVEAIHQRLYEMSGYRIRDDQTILLIKRSTD